MSKKIGFFFSFCFFLLSSVSATETPGYLWQQDMSSCVVNDTCTVLNKKNERRRKKCLPLADEKKSEEQVILIGNSCSAHKKTIENTEKILLNLLNFIEKIPLEIDSKLKLSDINIFIIYVPAENNTVELSSPAQQAENIPVIMIRFKKDIFFNFSSIHLNDTGSLIIKNFIHVLASSVEYRNITVVGHTDNVGTEKANLLLSKKRSDATILEIQRQISKQNIFLDNSTLLLEESIGVGESQPIAYFSQETQSEPNRRVEIFFSPSSSAIYNARKYIQCLYEKSSVPAGCFSKYLAR